ncbi:MAG: DUF3015 domain-containing protein [Thermodesulfovibrionales bacterium]|nr:DUF3015 domain-containing protein [Thermodesulfovibrionales bacterium]
MKKLVLLLMISLFITSTAFAAGQARRNTGCGLGTMLFKDSADDKWLLQAFQATTNGTFGNQTFGITTGTSECERATKIAGNEKLNQFVADNMDNLAKDIATGQGETLDTLAELMEVPPQYRSEFYSKLQANFSRIFTSSDIQAAEVLDNIISISSQS